MIWKYFKFSHSPVGVHLGCFKFFAVTNKVVGVPLPCLLLFLCECHSRVDTEKWYCLVIEDVHFNFNTHC